MATLAAIALVLLLCARRGPGPEARTIAQMWAGLRDLGWRAPIRAAAGLVAVVALVAGCMSILALGATVKTAQAAYVVGQATCWHVSDLIGWAPVRLAEDRA